MLLLTLFVIYILPLEAEQLICILIPNNHTQHTALQYYHIWPFHLLQVSRQTTSPNYLFYGYPKNLYLIKNIETKPHLPDSENISSITVETEKKKYSCDLFSFDNEFRNKSHLILYLHPLNINSYRIKNLLPKDNIFMIQNRDNIKLIDGELRLSVPINNISYTSLTNLRKRYKRQNEMGTLSDSDYNSNFIINHVVPSSSLYQRDNKIQFYGTGQLQSDLNSNEKDDVPYSRSLNQTHTGIESSNKASNVLAAQVIGNNQNQPLQYNIDRRTQVRYNANLPPQESQGIPTDARSPSSSSTVVRVEPITAQESNAVAEAGGGLSSRDLPPSLRAPFDQLDVMVGKFFRIPIPADTFYDYTDGSTPNLRLVLFNIDKVPVESDKRYNWIRLDPVNKQLYGLPTGLHIGLHELILAAYNKRGIPVHNAFTVLVQNRPKGFRTTSDVGVNHNFWIVIDEKRDFSKGGINGTLGPNRKNRDETDNIYAPPFNRNLHTQLAFFDKMIRYYHGLPGPTPPAFGGAATHHAYSLPDSVYPQASLNQSLMDQIYVESYGKGSVKVNWINDTLLTPPNLPLSMYSDYIKERGYNYSHLMACPQQDIINVAARFSEDPENLDRRPEERRFIVHRDFAKTMQPEFHVKSTGFDLYHQCADSEILAGKRGKTKITPIHTSKHDRDLWLTTIIPALVMALLLLLAGLIACCLYRRSSKPRFTTQEDRALFKKGVPVIIYPQEFGDLSNTSTTQEQQQSLLQQQPMIATTQIGGGGGTPPPAFNKQQILRVTTPYTTPIHYNDNKNPPKQVSSVTSNPYEPLLQSSTTDHYEKDVESRTKLT